ncbi:UPF0175 family protein [Dendronalium phyllosphericum]|uniref:UPF0175 family protein n=1 Tax=Dendronalium phyllosphericum TaxID=2840445 RepID=UPI001CEC26EB|nr:UPF0175 family protein [Dendronalium phyllosphericum]
MSVLIPDDILRALNMTEDELKLEIAHNCELRIANCAVSVTSNINVSTPITDITSFPSNENMEGQ